MSCVPVFCFGPDVEWAPQEQFRINCVSRQTTRLARQTTSVNLLRASYYDVVVGDAVNANAAWYYPTPKDAAQEIADYVAFYRNRVTVEV
jgi:uncharacterized protein (DUF427 family)